MMMFAAKLYNFTETRRLLNLLLESSVSIIHVSLLFYFIYVLRLHLTLLECVKRAKLKVC